jgi:hypothetical protein
MNRFDHPTLKSPCLTTKFLKSKFFQLAFSSVMMYSKGMGKKAPGQSIDTRVQNAISKREVQNLFGDAMQVLQEALDSDNENLRVGVAKYIVDQSVGKAAQEIKNDNAASRELAQAAARALDKLMETHPALKEGIIVEIPEVRVGEVLEIGDPEQEGGTSN